MAATGDVEPWGPVNALVSDVLHASSRTSRWAERRSAGATAGVLVGPQRHEGTTIEGAEESELVVAGSGNLGLVWFPRLPGRVRIEELQERFPALLSRGSSAEPGVAFVVVDSARGPLAIGRRGVRVLSSRRRRARTRSPRSVPGPPPTSPGWRPCPRRPTCC